MLISIDSSPCSLSLRNRSTLCSTTKCHQNKSDLTKVFVQKSFCFQYLLFFQSHSCLLESTAATFRQSAGYVLNFSTNDIRWNVYILVRLFVKTSPDDPTITDSNNYDSRISSKIPNSYPFVSKLVFPKKMQLFSGFGSYGLSTMLCYQTIFRQISHSLARAK